MPPPQEFQKTRNFLALQLPGMIKEDIGRLLLSKCLLATDVGTDAHRLNAKNRVFIGLHRSSSVFIGALSVAETLGRSWRPWRFPLPPPPLHHQHPKPRQPQHARWLRIKHHVRRRPRQRNKLVHVRPRLAVIPIHALWPPVRDIQIPILAERQIARATSVPPEACRGVCPNPIELPHAIGWTTDTARGEIRLSVIIVPSDVPSGANFPIVPPSSLRTYTSPSGPIVTSFGRLLANCPSNVPVCRS